MKKLTTKDMPRLVVSPSHNGYIQQKKPTCQQCQDAGFFVKDVPVGHPDFGVLQICDCKQHERKQRQKLHADKAARELAENLGKQHGLCTFDTFTTDWSTSQHNKLLVAIKDFCYSYAGDPKGWLFLHGKGGGYCGSGKSHLAAAIANQVIRNGMTVAYATVPDLFAYILSDWNKAEERIEQLSIVGLLVMDDAGQESIKGGGIDQFKEKFFRILNIRDRNNLPVVITSNYTIEELETMPHYSAAMISRIYGQTNGRRIFMNIGDYRRRK
jgi:DNA replication protein DnaC